jgi:hypothetical protein
MSNTSTIQVNGGTVGALYVLGLDPSQPVTLHDTSGQPARVWSVGDGGMGIPSRMSSSPSLTGPTLATATIPASTFNPGDTCMVKLGGVTGQPDFWVALAFANPEIASLPCAGFNLEGEPPRSRQDGHAGKASDGTNKLINAYLEAMDVRTRVRYPKGGGSSDGPGINAELSDRGEASLGDGSHIVTADTTIGTAGQVLRFRGGKLDRNGHVLTVDCAIDAPSNAQIFEDGVRLGPSGPKEVHAAWFGTGGAAIQAAHDALYDHGTIHVQQGGANVAATIATSKPIKLNLTQGGLTATSGCQAVIEASANIHVYGQDGFVSRITPLTGYPAIKLVGPWAQADDSDDSVVHLDKIGCEGGTSLLDIPAAFVFEEGLLMVTNCRAHGTTDYPIKIAASNFYGRIERNAFIICKGGMRIADDTETKCTNNVIWPRTPVLHAAAGSMSSSVNPTHLTIAGLDQTNVGDVVEVLGAGAGGRDLRATILSYSTGVAVLDKACATTVSGVDVYLGAFAYLITGGDHVDIIGDEIVMNRPICADIRIAAGLGNALDGIVTLENVKFGAENLYWLRQCPRIEVYTPANPTWAVAGTRILHNRIYGPSIGPAMGILTSIGRASNVATATVHTPGSPRGHGLQVGDTFHVVDCADHSFNGQNFTVTAIGSPGVSQTVSWASTGSNAGQSDQSGFVIPADTAAIELNSPVAGVLIEGNAIDNWAHAVDDTVPCTDETNAAHGRSVYRDNFELNNVGLPCYAFKSGFGRGFDIVQPGAQAAGPRFTNTPREIEATRLQNRVAYSEGAGAIANWNEVGMTLTSDTDPLGGSAAVNIARAGSDSFFTAVPPLTAFGEYVAPAFDNTGLGAGLYVKFWAKAGSLSSIMTAVVDLSSNFILPNSQRCIALTSTWTQFKIPVTIPAGAGTLLLAFCPGGPGILDCTAGDVSVWGVQVCDVDSDYAPTTGTAVDLTDTGARFARKVRMGALTASQAVVTDANKGLVSMAYTTAAAASSLLQLDASSRAAIKGLVSSGSAPTPSIIASTLGSTGTVSLETGSNDMAGVIILNPGGSGIAALASLALSYSTTLPGNAPTVQLTLVDSASSWGGAVAGASVPSVRVTSSSTTFFSLLAYNNHWDGAAVSGLTLVNGSDQYRIAYHVVCK